MTNLNQKLTEAIDALIPKANLVGKPGQTMLKPGGWIKEPELRHVLWALGVKKQEPEIEAYEDGTGVLRIYPLKGSSSDWDYDLTKSLYSQTDEVKEWLLNLLASPKGE